MSEPQEEPTFPMVDAEEMDIRERFVLLEERIQIVFWLAVAAEVGVLALTIILIVHSIKDGQS